MNILLIGPYNSVTDTVQDMLSETKKWIVKRLSFMELKKDAFKEDLSLIIACLGGVEQSPKMLIPKILEIHAGIPLLVLHYYEDKLLIQSLLETGATGYLQLGSGEDHLFEAVKTVGNGEKYIGPEYT